MRITEKPWYEELPETPAIRRAVAVLQEMAFRNSGFEVTLSAGRVVGGYGNAYTSEQMAAIWMLLSIGAYYREQMRRVYGELGVDDEMDEHPSQALGAAIDRFNKFTRCHFNIIIDGSIYRDDLSGSVIVFV